MSENRYHRQTLLKNINQERISNTTILIIGAGGLGCPALPYLAGAGVGHIGIVDHDTVDKTNLHRQILFTEDDIGRNKAEVAKERLQQLNSDVEIIAYSEQFTMDSRLRGNDVEELVQNYDLILDGTDNFKTKYLINDVCVKHEKPFITGSVLQMQGQIAVFTNTADSACYRCLYPAITNPPMNCNDAGVLGPVAGIVGTMMATIALTPGQWNNKLWTFDGATGRTATLNISKNKNCEVCTMNKDDIKLQDMTEEEISVCAVKALSTPYLIDIREQDEWDAGHIDGAVFHPLSRIQTGEMPDIPNDKDVVIYCRSGARSLYVTQILRGQGHHNVVNMAGGILAWDE